MLHQQPRACDGPRLYSQNGRIGEAPAERGSLSEYFPSIPIMSALMGKTAGDGVAASATASGSGFKGFAMVRGWLPIYCLPNAPMGAANSYCTV